MQPNPNALTAEHLAVIDPLEKQQTPEAMSVVTAEHLRILDEVEGACPVEPLQNNRREDVIDLMQMDGDDLSA